ncbi:hypothetical protein SCHPADRAFT_945187 [Schizopora paradoxa]|uniref:pH-response transcription factor pacC/RIM101 n=1 Tax=Schizopora paradoxa TaxID=27342 RepID=A0A0H2RDF4_9AGAM|nr:hypothetical protein SCHPADRAFT_945187 [Schizopora paradoxa]
MASSGLPAPDDGLLSSKREDAYRRSLRGSTSRTLSHWFPCDSSGYHVAPLTRTAQWPQGSHNSGISSRTQELRLSSKSTRNMSPSPAPSEVDELDSSDDEDMLDDSRPSTSLSTGPPESLASRSSTSRLPSVSPPLSESSDTAKRQPNFPGNRNIMDTGYSSGSPKTAYRDLPSPVSDNSSYRSLNSSHPSPLVNGRSLPEPIASSGDTREQVAHWRSYNSVPSRTASLQSYTCQGGIGSSSASRPTSSSSAPLSPPPVLPPILPRAVTALPNGGRIPSILQWNVPDQQQQQPSHRLKPSNYSDAEYDSAATPSTQSPYSQASPLPSQPLLLQRGGLQPSLSHSQLLQAESSLPPPPPRNKNAWKDHAVLVKGAQDQTEFRCVWHGGESGKDTDICGYTAKRHLVKRHIETRHLQFKDHKCEYCGKAFPQRVSLMIHVNRHTGEKPHKCRYDCDKTFSDPARRHKHMVEAHGYNPQGPRKRHRTTDSYHINSQFENLTPWTTSKDSTSDIENAAE